MENTLRSLQLTEKLDGIFRLCITEKTIYEVTGITITAWTTKFHAQGSTS